MLIIFNSKRIYRVIAYLFVSLGLLASLGSVTVRADFPQPAAIWTDISDQILPPPPDDPAGTHEVDSTFTFLPQSAMQLTTIGGAWAA